MGAARRARAASLIRLPAGIMSITSPDPPPPPSAPPAPTRHVEHGDGLAFLRRAPLPATHAIVTSLPDLSELPGLDAAAWTAWFVDTSALVCRQLADDAVAVFYQTDIKRDGRWIDKGYLVQRGAEAAGSHLLWHKLVCRVPPGVITMGRPAYAHLLAFSRALRVSPGRSTADVLPSTGAMTWSRAMGVAACEAAARFVREQTACTTIVDPFCGVGTMLAVANAHGLHAVGVELAKKRARRARVITLDAIRAEAARGPAPDGGDDRADPRDD